LSGYGIDPDEVDRAAVAQARESVKKLKDAA
jgi:hypothetical protein